MSETLQEATLTVSPKDQRKRLFSVLNDIIGFSEEKRKLKGNSDRNKQSWSRICISAIEAYGSLLKSQELEDIVARLEVLEQNKFEKVFQS